jgi:DNA ligase (NAD+)
MDVHHIYDTYYYWSINNHNGKYMKKLDEIRNLILRAKQCYYYGNSPIMSDSEFDMLEKKLRVMSPNDPILSMVGAPVPPDNILAKAKHSMPMGSQNKVNSKDEFMIWVAKYCYGQKIHCSLKADGGSAAAYYKHGKLVQAISRGDGDEGEDITANAMKFKGLPASIAGFNGSIRFEVALTADDYKIVHPEQKTHPRNIGNGIMGRKDGTQSEYLSVFAFDMVDDDCVYETEEEKSRALEQMGVQVITWFIFNDGHEVCEWYNNVMANRNTLPLRIDGVVLKCNSLDVQDKFGVSDGRPKAQVAWKPENEYYTTTLMDVTIDVGHTGAINPVAKLKPIEIDGAIVTNASLCNYDEIKRLDIAIGDDVLVYKANLIIPKLAGVSKKAKDRILIKEPTSCPVCGGNIGRNTNTDGSNGAVTICLNPDCEAKSVGKIKRWIDSLDIKNIGDTVLEAMVSELNLKDAADLYTVTVDQLQKLTVGNGILGTKRAESIIAEINKTRKLTIDQFIGSLGIKFLGKRKVEIIRNIAAGLIEHLDTIDEWLDGRLISYKAQLGIVNTAKDIQDDIKKSEWLIKKLLQNGVEVIKPVKPKQEKVMSGGKFNGWVACFTGIRMVAGEAAAFAAGGGIEKSSVTKEVTHLVCKDVTLTSNKIKKAKESGVKIISIDEFRSML